MGKLQLFMKAELKQKVTDQLHTLENQHTQLEEENKLKRNRLKSYNKFETLLKEINHHSYGSQYYWVLFVLRRVIFITICIYSHNNSYLQSATLIVLFMIISTFVYSMSPFQILRKNYIENFNELMLFLCALFQMVLAGYTFDNSTGKAS